MAKLFSPYCLKYLSFHGHEESVVAWRRCREGTDWEEQLGFTMRTRLQFGVGYSSQKF